MCGHGLKKQKKKYALGLSNGNLNASQTNK